MAETIKADPHLERTIIICTVFIFALLILDAAFNKQGRTPSTPPSYTANGPNFDRSICARIFRITGVDGGLSENFDRNDPNYDTLVTAVANGQPIESRSGQGITQLCTTTP